MSKKVLVIAASLVLVLGAAVGAGVYFIIQTQIPVASVLKRLPSSCQRKRPSTSP